MLVSRQPVFWIEPISSVEQVIICLWNHNQKVVHVMGFYFPKKFHHLRDETPTAYLHGQVRERLIRYYE